MSNEGGISVYPNPANDLLILQNAGAKTLTVEIENSLGQVIFSTHIHGSSKVFISIKD